MRRTLYVWSTSETDVKYTIRITLTAIALIQKHYKTSQSPIVQSEKQTMPRSSSQPVNSVPPLSPSLSSSILDNSLRLQNAPQTRNIPPRQLEHRLPSSKRQGRDKGGRIPHVDAPQQGRHTLVLENRREAVIGEGAVDGAKAGEYTRHRGSREGDRAVLQRTRQHTAEGVRG